MTRDHMLGLAALPQGTDPLTRSLHNSEWSKMLDRCIQPQEIAGQDPALAAFEVGEHVIGGGVVPAAYARNLRLAAGAPEGTPFMSRRPY